MAITYVGKKTAFKAGSTSGNSTISLSSGLTGGSRGAVAEGDYVIAIFASGSVADRALSITDGSANYGLLGSELYVNGSVDLNLRVAAKFMGSTPDGSVTFGPSGNNNDGASLGVLVFSGVDPTTPLDVSVQTASLTSSILANPPSITPSTAGAFIVCIGAGALNAPPSSYTASGLTDFVSVGSTDVLCSVLGFGHKPDWTSGPYDQGAFSYSLDNSAYSSAAMTIALRPDPAASSSGQIKTWNGSAWVAKPVKVWNGSIWVAKPVKRWNGSAWVATPY